MQVARYGFLSAIGLFFAWIFLAVVLMMIGVPTALAVWGVAAVCVIALAGMIYATVQQTARR